MKRKPFIPLLILFLAPIIPLWKIIFQAQAIGPFDQIAQMAPWNRSAPGTPWDVLQADGVLQFYPWRDLVFHAWSTFQVPFWNQYELAGTPLLANSQSGGLYPPHILVGVLHFPTSLAISALAWFHLFWAGVGVYLLSRSLGGSRLGATIGGLSFMLSPFMLAWTALPSVISTVCWIPFILWSIHQLISVDEKNRNSGKIPAFLAASVAMMILAGHLQFSFYGLLAAGLFALVNFALSDRKTFPNLLGVLGGLGLGVTLTAIQLYPVVQFSKTSNRRNQASEAGYQAYISSAIKPFELATLSNPDSLGFPRDSATDKSPSLSTYWPPLLKNGGNYAESAICIGPFVLGLLGLVRWREKRVWATAVVACISFLLCIGTPLNRLLYFYIPGWSATGSPGRIVVLLVMMVCVLAGASLKEDASVTTKSKLISSLVLVVLGILLSNYAVVFAPEASQGLVSTVEALQIAAGYKSQTVVLISSGLATMGILCALSFDSFKNSEP